MWLQSATEKQVNLFSIFRLRLGRDFGQLPGRVRLAVGIGVNCAKPLSIRCVGRVRMNE
jgi:hypothetical protein